jgi:hypothetical protein
MKKLLPILILAATVAVGSFALPAGAAAEAKPTTPKAAAAPKETDPAKLTTFRGGIASVDSIAKSVTVTNRAGPSRTFVVTSTTKIMSGGKPAVFQDAKPGEEAGGSYRTTADGKLELATLRVGPVPKKDSAATTEKTVPKENPAK